MPELNQNPEQKARDKIDDLLRESGWVVQHPKAIDFSAGSGGVVREYQKDGEPVDYAQFVNQKIPCHVATVVRDPMIIGSVDILKLSQNGLDRVADVMSGLTPIIKRK